jgi:2-dehydropantoate 2-reductase
MLRFAVIGAGGVGGYFGGRLAAAGHDVTFVARGAHLEALRRDGLAVSSVAGDFTVDPVRATTDPGGVGEVDAVLLAVKTWQVRPAAEAAKPLVGKETAVITLQNGVDAPGEAAEVVGRRAVLPGIAKVIAFLERPGRVRHSGGPGSMLFAEWDNRHTARVARIREAVAASGIPTAEPEEIWAELWAKLLFVVPLGGLGAVADVPFGVLRERPGMRRLLRDAMTEIEQVASARGVTLPDGVVDATMAFVDAQPADGTTSLHRDIRDGRRSELDAWTGAVVRLGESAGVPTPINRFCLELLKLRLGSPHPA